MRRIIGALLLSAAIALPRAAGAAESAAVQNAPAEPQPSRKVTELDAGGCKASFPLGVDPSRGHYIWHGKCANGYAEGSGVLEFVARQGPASRILTRAGFERGMAAVLPIEIVVVYADGRITYTARTSKDTTETDQAPAWAAQYLKR